jgi:hypothetical protein
VHKTKPPSGYERADLDVYWQGNIQCLRRPPDALALWAWNEHHTYVHSLRDFVARHGTAVIPGLVRRDWVRYLAWEGGEWLAAAKLLVSPRIAPAMARVYSRRKRYRREALAWLEEHVVEAALGLIPNSLGEACSDAERALAVLAQRGHAEAIRAAAARYGAAAQAAIDELLARDPLAVEQALPKWPSFLHAGDLPPVTLRSGEALGDEARRGLLEMLSLSSADEPYPGLALVRSACDEGTLAAFALELLEQWVLGDAPGRHEWMAAAVVHFPSLAATRRTGALAREWSRGAAAKAGRALALLAADGSDLALVHLAHVAVSARASAVREQAAALLAEAAAQRGLGEDELGDRTVPDMGLDADGTLALSYGARRFVVSLDGTLEPVVRERGEAGLGALPRPTKEDDKALAAAAKERFAALAADVRAVADRLVRRLERAMVTGRSWTLPDFEVFVARHPLVGHVARALVWEVVGGGTFRVAEDGSYADAGDARVELASAARVRVAHPARTLGLDAAWSGLFGDYIIVQPFEQLARATFGLDAAERAAEELARTAGGVREEAPRRPRGARLAARRRRRAGRVSLRRRRRHGGVADRPGLRDRAAAPRPAADHRGRAHRGRRRGAAAMGLGRRRARLRGAARRRAPPRRVVTGELRRARMVPAPREGLRRPRAPRPPARAERAASLVARLRAPPRRVTRAASGEQRQRDQRRQRRAGRRRSVRAGAAAGPRREPRRDHRDLAWGGALAAIVGAPHGRPRAKVQGSSSSRRDSVAPPGPVS